MEAAEGPDVPVVRDYPCACGATVTATHDSTEEAMRQHVASVSHQRWRQRLEVMNVTTEPVLGPTPCIDCGAPITWFGGPRWKNRDGTPHGCRLYEPRQP